MSERLDTVWKSPELARRYLTGVRGAIPGAQLQLEVMLHLLKSVGRPIRSFLDLGCGSGTLGAVILDAFPNVRGVFADFSEPMLAAAKTALFGRGHCGFALADYADPTWTQSIQHAPFDAVVSGFSIHHQPDAIKRRIYADIYGLLAPGGVFVNIEHVRPSGDSAHTLFEEHMVENLFTQEEASGGSRTRANIRTDFLNRDDAQANILAPVDEQLAWLRDIGFTNVDCYMHIYELAVLAGFRQ